MTKKIANYGMLIALAFTFSYIESLIPFNFGLPGMKLGLANLIVLIALYSVGTAGAFVISLIRIILTGFTFGSMYSILYSLAGGLLSFAVMIICKNCRLLSKIGISIAGGAAHNTGQVLMAMFVLHTSGLIYYLGVLLVFGTAAGALIGLLGGIVLTKLKLFQLSI